MACPKEHLIWVGRDSVRAKKQNEFPRNPARRQTPINFVLVNWTNEPKEGIGGASSSLKRLHGASLDPFGHWFLGSLAPPLGQALNQRVRLLQLCKFRSPKVTIVGFFNPALPYCRGWPSSVHTVPPAASTMHCAAAVSHSIVGTSRR